MKLRKKMNYKEYQEKRKQVEKNLVYHLYASIAVCSVLIVGSTLAVGYFFNGWFS